MSKKLSSNGERMFGMTLLGQRLTKKRMNGKIRIFFILSAPM
jgi:hypothetical protein